MKEHAELKLANDSFIVFNLEFYYIYYTLLYANSLIIHIIYCSIK